MPEHSIAPVCAESEPANGGDGPLQLFPISARGEGKRARERPAIEGKVSGKRLLRLLDAQGKRCALTGVDLTPETISLDHINSLVDGGGDDMSNVQLVHQVINSMKGTMSQAEFVRWCRLVVEHQAG